MVFQYSKMLVHVAVDSCRYCWKGLDRKGQVAAGVGGEHLIESFERTCCTLKDMQVVLAVL